MKYAIYVRLSPTESNRLYQYGPYEYLDQARAALFKAKAKYKNQHLFIGVVQDNQN